jgi:hypothetical protein
VPATLLLLLVVLVAVAADGAAAHRLLWIETCFANECFTLQLWFVFCTLHPSNYFLRSTSRLNHTLTSVTFFALLSSDEEAKKIAEPKKQRELDDLCLRARALALVYCNRTYEVAGRDRLSG